MILLISIMAILTLTDYLYWKIPNLIVIPAIIFGCIKTGNWIPAIIMFLMASYVYKKKIWYGGDVKLITLVASFIGILALPIFVATWISIYLFRIIKDNNRPLPVAPFMFIVTIGTIGLLHLCRMMTP